MYNTKKIEKIIKEIEKEISLIIEKKEIELNEAIKKQIPKGHKLYSGMGVVFCNNKKGEYVGEKFCSYLQQYLYNDAIDTGLSIDEFDNSK